MPFNKKYYLTSPDLQQRDWVLFSMQNLIENVDPQISVKIVTLGTSKLLVASQISENSITKLSFLTNNDANNNYLYLENFSVYLNLYNEPLNIPGLNEIVINQYRRSDIINGFIAGKNTFQPFCSCNLGNINFNEMVDNITSIIPGCTSTKNKQKFYEIVLNPDLPEAPSAATAPSGSSVPSAPSNISVPSNISIPSNIDTSYLNNSLEAKQKLQDAVDCLNKFKEIAETASALYNKVKTEAEGVPAALIKTFSNPVNNIFFLSQPKKAIVSTVSKIKNLFRRRR